MGFDLMLGVESNTRKPHHACHQSHRYASEKIMSRTSQEENCCFTYCHDSLCEREKLSVTGLGRAIKSGTDEKHNSGVRVAFEDTKAFEDTHQNRKHDRAKMMAVLERKKGFYATGNVQVIPASRCSMSASD